MPEKSVSDEIAELAKAIGELRDREVAGELAALRAEVEKLRAERGHHHCSGCSCMHVHWHYPTTWTHQGTVTYPNYVVTNTMTTTGTNPAITWTTN